MKKVVVAAGVLALCSAMSAVGQEGNWMARVRVVNLGMENKSDAGSGPLAGVRSDAIHVSDKTIPEVDFSYFFTKNLAAELILTIPQKHTVTLNGTSLGTFKHLPPTLTLQYHFAPDSQFRPYVGAGINYTIISGVSLSAGPGVNVGLENHSIGGALQAGFDVKMANNLYLNVDVKKIYIGSDVTVNGTKASHAKLDPVAFGVGLGWRF